MPLTVLAGVLPADTRGPVLVAAYNEMCDPATERHAARRVRLPERVFDTVAASLE